MGLIKAGLGALGGVLADQWKEYFYCEAMDMDTLMVKGQKRVSGRSSNTRGSDNIISNGAIIAVKRFTSVVSKPSVSRFTFSLVDKTASIRSLSIPSINPLIVVIGVLSS